MINVLFIHGGGEGAHEEDSKLADSLRQKLGTSYNVVNPQMPNEDAPEYDAWKLKISQEIAALGDGVIAVGHSLGASFWLQYLTDQQVHRPIAAIFLLATPYWGAPDWEVDEYTLLQGFAVHLPQVPVFMYHNRDDEVIPFAHLAMYAEQIPQAIIREYDTGGHQFNNDLSAVAADILSLPN